MNGAKPLREPGPARSSALAPAGGEQADREALGGAVQEQLVVSHLPAGCIQAHGADGVRGGEGAQGEVDAVRRARLGQEGLAVQREGDLADRLPAHPPVAVPVRLRTGPVPDAARPGCRAGSRRADAAPADPLKTPTNKAS